jgi:5-methylcytosine-specific restriction endonuclease McrA
VRAHPDEHRAHGAKWLREHPTYAVAKTARWRKKNPKKHMEHVTKWKAANRDKVNANAAIHRKANPERGVEKTARYRAAKRRAVPAWANRFFMREAYALAKLRTKLFGYEWHVDHIVPLRHPLVQGLHVEHNLRVIPAVHNIAKSNLVWPDMP